MASHSTKSELRGRLRLARASLPPELVEGWSAILAARVGSLDLWQQASVVHTYVGALAGEVRTDLLIRRALQHRQRVICPRVRPHGQLAHHELSDVSELVRSAFGLVEPDSDRCPPVDPSLAVIILVPAVAFTEAGDRLGMGGGYYDRFLAEPNMQSRPRIGLAFEMQLTDAIPRAEHDVGVDLIVTELRVIRCR